MTAAAPAVQHVEANGLRFAYLEEGAGPLVLFLHGFPDTARSWDHARAAVAARGFRAVSPWMRGYAPTAAPAKDTDAETLGRDVLALITALGADDAIVVGHDWGALAAHAAASLEPTRLRTLVTIAIPHPGTWRIRPRKLWRNRHFVSYKLPGAARRFARDDFAAVAAIYRRWSPAWTPDDSELAAVRASFADPASLDAAFGYYRRLQFRPPGWQRAPIAVPTIAFAGATDTVAAIDDYHHARRAFTGPYTIEELPGGHFMHREHPDLFVERLLRHLPAR